jgi:uncharacterized cysteine cluster protein YcgN (CxxCxxCC family)
MASWEETCKRCGLCCFEKSVDRSGRLQTTRVPCRHLDIVSRECRVYHKRLEVGEGCVKLTPDIVRQVDWLPESCAYRENPARETKAEREKLGPK